MAGMIGCWIAGLILVCVLTAVNCSFNVITGAALGMLALSLAWDYLSRRREIRRLQAREGRPRARVPAEASLRLAAVLAGISPWTESDEVILKGDLSLRAWRAAGQMRQRDSR